ncbi:MAG: hypothetical protein H0V27_12620 [Pyrinomonadaceae bacterium]|nr:hypothetical protein [Pyrinomonadaceae bacterium]
MILSDGSISNRMVALMRLVLAIGALLVTYLDSIRAGGYASVTYTTLALYLVYSLVLYLSEAFRRPLLPALVAHWIDVGWYTMVIALSGSTNSVFFFGFFFSVMAASFRWGFGSGVRVAIFSAVLFIVVGFAIGFYDQTGFKYDSFLTRSAVLVVLGFMIAYWGGSEITLKRRLALLKEVSTLSNPRFGIDRTLGNVMERLRAFYDAETCLLIMNEHGTSEYRLRRAERGKPERAMRSEPFDDRAASQFLFLPETHSFVCNSGWYGLNFDKRFYAMNAATGEKTIDGEEDCHRLAGLLDAECFVTVPVKIRNETVGRLFLTARRRTYDDSDAAFLFQLMEQVVPTVEIIRLVDRLASDAAETERQRIARDIHDSVIQPYIGIQIGLAAIRQKLDLGGFDVMSDVKNLIEISGSEINGLRNYMSGLRNAHARDGSLVPAVERFAAKFSEAAGIKVRVEADSDGIHVNDRLAAEAFQMVAEGLSNIRRHTEATRAHINLAQLDNRFQLVIANDDPANGAARPSFVPRSITERASALGGRASVTRDDGETIVRVEIPL